MPSDKLAANSKITIAEQDLIDTYLDVGPAFLRKVLRQSWDACLLTDESELRDFSFSGMPAGLIPEGVDLQESYRIWDRWVLAKVEEVYDLKLATTCIRLVALFELLRQQGQQRIH